jgi:hypothetical protein
MFLSSGRVGARAEALDSIGAVDWRCCFGNFALRSAPAMDRKGLAAVCKCHTHEAVGVYTWVNHLPVSFVLAEGLPVLRVDYVPFVSML